MDSSQEDEYYPIVHLFPTGEDRFDISNFTDVYKEFVLCNSIGPGNRNDEMAFLSDCPQVAKYIKVIYTKHPTENEAHRCKYLNYSINSVVKNNKKPNYSEEQLIKAYGRLATELRVCEDNIKVIDSTVFNNVKDLSNIYYEFNKYKNAIDANQPPDCQDLSHIIQLYLNKKKNCNSETKIFCDAVDKFKNDYLSKISQVKCKNGVYTLETFLSFDHTKPLSFEEEEVEAEEAGVEEVVRGQVMSDITPNQEDSSEIGQSKGTITTASSIVLVLSSASFIFYKFTPLGTWLRPLVQRKNKKTISMYDEALRFNNNSSFQTNDSGNTEFNLQYHSSRTS